MGAGQPRLPTYMYCRGWAGRAQLLSYHTMLQLLAVELAAVAARPPVPLPPAVAAAPAFEIFWNAPSAGCSGGAHPLAPAAYGLQVNKGQAFAGDKITCFYHIGLLPTLRGQLNGTACWTKARPCASEPWGEINATSNGGVPQAADLAAHTAAVKSDVAGQISDADFAGVLVVDYEAWRPLFSECYDTKSVYQEYSRRLVRADPTFGDRANATAVEAEAERRFDAGAKAFFTATVEAIRTVRPKARIGFYSQGINGPNSTGGRESNSALIWLWELVDVLCPSIYPHSLNATREAASAASYVAGAIASAEMVTGRPRPAVMPYARALMTDMVPSLPFDPGVLAAQVQVAAGLGAEGVILWGASSDYHKNGCATIEAELTNFAGPTMQACIANRDTCTATHCSGHGRCVDYAPERLIETCVSEVDHRHKSKWVRTCRCDYGFSGDDCSAGSRLLPARELPVAPPPDDTKIVGERFIEQIQVPASEVGSTVAQALASAATLQPDGHWKDVDYKDKSRGAWKTELHIRRCENLALAMQCCARSDVREPECGRAHRVTLAAAAKSAIGYWLTHDFQNPNWWCNQIGVPQEFVTIAFMLQSAGLFEGSAALLSDAQRAEVHKIMKRSGDSGTTHWTGANLVWMMRVQVARGVLFGNRTAVSAGFARLWQEIYWSHAGDDNIQRDGSFHQHSEEGARGALLAGSYGSTYTGDLLAVIDLAHNTSAALPDGTANIFSSLILDGQQWMLTRRGTFDWSVVGRDQSSPSSGYRAAAGWPLKYLAQLPAERQPELQNFRACMADPAAAACVPISGNRHYFDSDYMVHRRADYMLTLRMYSNRTIAARCVNSQGKLDSREADGVTNLFVTGAEYDNIFGAWDFHRVSGMVSEVDIPLLKCEKNSYSGWPAEMNYTTFVGGVSDGTTGAAAMNLSSGTLHVQNGWFFFDDGYLHLGSGLHCATGSSVATTLAHRRLDSAGVHIEDGGGAVAAGEQNYTAQQAPSWVWFGDTTDGAAGLGQGYRPLYGAAGGLTGEDPRVLRLRTGNESGNWSNLGTSHGTDTLATFQLSFELGTCAEAASAFAYAVQPSVTLAAVKAKLPWTVVSNTVAVQAVREGDDRVQAIFWAAGKTTVSASSVAIQTLTSSAPALVLVEETGGAMTVSASEPSGTVGKLHVVVRGNSTFAGSNCSAAASGGGTVFALALPAKGDWQGKTVSVTCKLKAEDEDIEAAAV